MKRIIYYFTSTLAILLFSQWVFSLGEEYFQAKFMALDQAEKRWGIKPFDAKKFKTATAQERAPMAVDLAKRKIYVGESRKKVRDDLGDPDGYFFSDTIYAYQIERGTPEKLEAWQLVFIPDKDLKKVKEVKIHKKCCYETPPWAK